jgi:hypothetical protein
MKGAMFLLFEFMEIAFAYPLKKRSSFNDQI